MASQHPNAQVAKHIIGTHFLLARMLTMLVRISAHGVYQYAHKERPDAQIGLRVEIFTVAPNAHSNGAPIAFVAAFWYYAHP